MAQESPRSILGLPTYLHTRPNIRLHLAPCLFRVSSVRKSPPSLFPHHSFRSPNRPNSTNIVILIVSAICAVLSVTEIILFAATRLHPLTYLILQLVKTVTWFVLFVLAAVDSTKVQNEMKGAEEQGYDLGSRSEYFYLQWFAEPLVLL